MNAKEWCHCKNDGGMSFFRLALFEILRKKFRKNFKTPKKLISFEKLLF